jgi:hypothetical protein
MDAEHFDSLTRALQTVRSRRTLTAFLASLAAGGSLALRPADGIAVKRKKAGGKKGGKKKKSAPSSPPNSPPPVSPPPPPPPPSCTGAGAPHFCQSAGVCVPGCPAGKVFDATTCKCKCLEENTCCYCSCQGGTSFQCFPSGIASEAACRTACGDFCDEDPTTVAISFAGGNGRNAVCNFGTDTCDLNCVSDIACGSANSCVVSAARCNDGSDLCLQPLGGGPTRCGESVSTTCGCTSNADCAGQGAGAYCAKGTGPNCSFCSGANFCALPR